MGETRVLPRRDDAAATEVTPGEMLGSYRVLRKLGAGGMGAVYLGEHVLIGRKVAIKVLLPHVSHNQEIVQRFFNEARIASALDHPGIVQVFDFGHRQDGRAYLVMEYLDGEALGTRLARRGRLSLGESLRIVHQCAGALSVAHRRGVVHRDIKPDNVIMIVDPLVEGGERAKLLDFGIAKLTGPERGGLMTRAGTIMGTPLYMAPEQCSGAGGVDHRADIYALGCVLFHLVCGRPPFDGPGSGAIMAAHMRAPAPAPSARVPGIPAAVDGIVARCLAKSPDERFATMAELDAAIVMASSHPAAVAPTMAAAVSSTQPAVTPPVAPAADRPPSSPGATAPITTLGSATGQSRAARSQRLAHTAQLVAGLIAGGIGIGLVAIIAQDISHGPVTEPDRAAVPFASGPAVPSEITVRIESDPPGASVFLPGASAPVGVTPYEYRTKARTGQLTVRLEHDGYLAGEATFALDRSRVVSTVLTQREAVQPDAGPQPERPRQKKKPPRRTPSKGPLDYR